MKRLFLLLAITGCDPTPPNSDQLQRQQQEKLSLEATRQVGMPAIINFQEKRILKDILELRDKEIPTTTYIVDLNGKLHKLCTSLGFGVPYATQFTNPQRTVISGQSGIATIPQADPNGLFSPGSADGTWVLCLNPKTKKTSPVYVEPRIIVSPFELDSTP